MRVRRRFRKFGVRSVVFPVRVGFCGATLVDSGRRGGLSMGFKYSSKTPPLYLLHTNITNHDKIDEST